MTKINGNPLLKGATGMIGETFYLRKTFDQQQIVNRPKRRTSQTKKERENQNRFLRATNWAKKQVAIPKIKDEYAEGITPKKRSAYHVAVSDHLNAPKVVYIKTKPYTGAIGDTITIKATDDFKVIRVKVDILNAKNEIIEHGEAKRFIFRPFIWKYKATVANKKVHGTMIKVVAFDKPGNRGESEVKL